MSHPKPFTVASWNIHKGVGADRRRDLARTAAVIDCGLRLPGDETGDCFKFTNSLSAMAEALGVTFRYGVSIDGLAEPVPVLLSYGTTLVKGDQIFFFNDIYGHDRVLTQALQQRSRSRAK